MAHMLEEEEGRLEKYLAMTKWKLFIAEAEICKSSKTSVKPCI